MAALDVILAAILLWGAFKGWSGGLFRQLASIGGVLAGLIVARMLYAVLGDYLAPHLGTPQTVAYVLAFILIWVGVPMALSVGAFLLTKTAETLSLGGLNRLGGAVIGVLKYCIVLSCLLHVFTVFHWIDEEKAESSVLVRPVSRTGAFLFRCMKATWEVAVQPQSDHREETDSLKVSAQPDDC